MGQSSEWSCRVEVFGLEPPFDKSSTGVDSFQALCLALRLLCVHLDKVTGNLVFLDGKADESGIPLIVPWSFGPSLKAEVHKLIQERIEDELNSGR